MRSLHFSSEHSPSRAGRGSGEEKNSFVSSLKSLLSPPGGPASLWNRFPPIHVVCGRVCLCRSLRRLLLQVAPSSSISVFEPDLPLALKLRFQCVSVCLHLGLAKTKHAGLSPPSRPALLVLVFSWPTRLHRRCLIFGAARGVYCRIYKMLQNY